MTSIVDLAYIYIYSQLVIGQIATRRDKTISWSTVSSYINVYVCAASMNPLLYKIVNKYLTKCD